MNHLAHLLLAGADDDYRLGALLGDHVKGRAALEALPAAVAGGVRLHRHIDSFTDGHPAVGALLTRLEPPFRRYGGVIMDILFDHMLDRHWARFAQIPLPDFAAQIDDLLIKRRAELPPRLQRFAAWARAVRLWTRYGERRMLAEIFARVAARHGRPSPLARGLEVLDTHEAAIEAGFLELFPDLRVSTALVRAYTPR